MEGKKLGIQVLLIIGTHLITVCSHLIAGAHNYMGSRSKEASSLEPGLEEFLRK